MQDRQRDKRQRKRCEKHRDCSIGIHYKTRDRVGKSGQQHVNRNLSGEIEAWDLRTDFVHGAPKHHDICQGDGHPSNDQRVADPFR